jgi:UDP-N-acetylmuramoyl-L-alanyl-D-glutamate--2,6-diaminopimelate ligase
LVDYAHTPDGLENALQALRPHCSGRLFVVFGCGGDRDVGKRPLMAQVAEKLADVLVVTSDNPRSEEPQSIVIDVLAGLQDAASAQVFVDRAEAIAAAINQANETDCVLIAGKGHEDYQVIGDKILPFDDCSVAAVCLAGRS